MTAADPVPQTGLPAFLNADRPRLALLCPSDFKMVVDYVVGAAQEKLRGEKMPFITLDVLRVRLSPLNGDSNRTWGSQEWVQSELADSGIDASIPTISRADGALQRKLNIGPIKDNAERRRGPGSHQYPKEKRRNPDHVTPVWDNTPALDWVSETFMRAMLALQLFGSQVTLSSSAFLPLGTSHPAVDRPDPPPNEATSSDPHVMSIIEATGQEKRGGRTAPQGRKFVPSNLMDKTEEVQAPAERAEKGVVGSTSVWTGAGPDASSASVEKPRRGRTAAAPSKAEKPPFKPLVDLDAITELCRLVKGLRFHSAPWWLRESAPFGGMAWCRELVAYGRWESKRRGENFGGGWLRKTLENWVAERKAGRTPCWPDPFADELKRQGERVSRASRAQGDSAVAPAVATAATATTLPPMGLTAAQEASWRAAEAIARPPVLDASWRKFEIIAQSRLGTLTYRSFVANGALLPIGWDAATRTATLLAATLPGRQRLAQRGPEIEEILRDALGLAVGETLHVRLVTDADERAGDGSPP